MIADRDKLFVQTPEGFGQRFNIDVRVENEVTAIDTTAKTVTVQKTDGTTYTESYDKLLLSPGSTPVVPPLNAQGNCVVHSKRFDNGWRRDIYEYDESGNRIFEGRCEKFNKKNLCDCKESYFNHGYEYDDQHHVTRDYLIGDWKPRGWDYYYQYDSVGREIEFKIYETNGKERTFRAHIVSSYDSIGRIVSKEALSGTFFINEAFARYTRNAIHQTWEYDTYGNLLLEKVYQDESGPFRVLKYTYEYDGHGNWIKRCRYEGDSEDVLELTETLERVISYY